MTVLGLDLSLSNTGVAVIYGRTVHTESIPTNTKEFKSNIFRCSYIAHEILKLVCKYEPELIVVEGYAFGASFSKQSNNLTRLAELKGILLYLITLRFPEIRIIDVATTSMKKYVTKKGRVEIPDSVMKSKRSLYAKEVVLNCVNELLHRAGGVTKILSNHDEADALGLAMIGHHLFTGQSFVYIDDEQLKIQEQIIEKLIEDKD